MEEDQEIMKHFCKLCNKSFPCGRSLGGHMRSHLINNNNDHHHSTDNKVLISKKKQICSSMISNGYGRRENRKKTTRSKFANSNSENVIINKVCKECGKGFQSWKALFGHMKCHSSHKLLVVSSNNNNINTTFGDNYDLDHDHDSWNFNCSSSAAAAAADDDDDAYDDQSDHETTTTPVRKQRSRTTQKRYQNGKFPSNISEIDQHEQEEVALSLILLSRHHVQGCWDSSEFLQVSKNGKIESISLDSEQKLKDSEEKTESHESKVAEFEFTKQNSTKRKTESSMDDFERKSKFECAACNKSFHSYQALGGHRASHKKMKGSKIDSSENSTTENADSSAVVKLEGKTDYDHHHQIKKNRISSSNIVVDDHNGGSNRNNKVHECPICFKVFSSGQALGGHKRSHLIADAKSNQQNTTTTSVKKVSEIRDFLDLNLPPPPPLQPEDEESSDQVYFNSWWIGSNHSHEQQQQQLVGLL